MKNHKLANPSQRKNERGSVLAYMVLSALFLIFAVALGVDLSHLYLVKAELQNAADAAALAAAKGLRHTPISERIQFAVDEAVNTTNLNQYNFSNLTFAGSKSTAERRALVTFAKNLDDNPYKTEAEANADANKDKFRFVKVLTPSVPVNVFFATPLLGSSQTLNAKATAGASGGNGGCVFALNATAKQDAIVASGGLTDVEIQCGVFVNSTSSKAIEATGGACITADSINIAGGYNGCFTPTPTTSFPPVEDPLASLPTPTPTPPYAPCDANHTNWHNKNPTLSPGVYCGGITVSGGYTATFSPGTYILNGGGLIVSGSTVSGVGVTFYNTNNGKIAISSSDGTLKAPTTGPMAGILFFQNPADTQKAVLSGGTTLTIEGALYFPKALLEFSGGTSGSGDYLVLVADTIKFTGGSSAISANYSGLQNGSPIKGPLFVLYRNGGEL